MDQSQFMESLLKLLLGSMSSVQLYIGPWGTFLGLSSLFNLTKGQQASPNLQQPVASLILSASYTAKLTTCSMYI